ncbi:MAG: MBL fold metallo-hydrolase [Oscillospiraceae bacterium]|nr:MBL fold metallo-hydrolase [Oscillospiraceae bacterium]
MHPLRFGTLFSGSSGNSVFVEYNNTRLLIDIGRGPRVTQRALEAVGCCGSRIDAVFVTHEHGDHISGVGRIAGRHEIPVHLPRGCATSAAGLPEDTHLHDPIFEAEVGADGVRVTSFATPHDSRMSVGYIVQAGGYRLGVATDMGMLTKGVVAALAGCHSVVIESNYDPRMLENGQYPAFLKRRILSDKGHLSNADGALLAAVLVNAGTENVILAHLSDENNTPALALEATAEELARRNLRANVLTADRHMPTLVNVGA